MIDFNLILSKIFLFHRRSRTSAAYAPSRSQRQAISSPICTCTADLGRSNATSAPEAFPSTPIWKITSFYTQVGDILIKWLRSQSLRRSDLQQPAVVLTIIIVHPVRLRRSKAMYHFGEEILSYNLFFSLSLSCTPLSPSSMLINIKFAHVLLFRFLNEECPGGRRLLTFVVHRSLRKKLIISLSCPCSAR